MPYIEVIGGRQLHGELEIHGSKNAVLPILAASVLHKGVTKIKRCPKISDVYSMIKLMERIGCVVIWEKDQLVVDAREINYNAVDRKYVSAMRSSIILLGSLLGRNHSVTISYPGGCAIGARPIDLHLSAIKKLNVEILSNDDLIFCSTAHLQGGKIHLAIPSVGATENAILAAVLADGVTEIQNAAKEPEIQELCDFLNQMGAKVLGGGTRHIHVEGVNELHDVEYELGSDRIVMGTYMAAVAGTGGDITLRGSSALDMKATIETLRKMGCRIGIGNDYVNICSYARPKPLEHLQTAYYPGFPTDMQSQVMSVLAIADGSSLVVENIFESRYQTVNELVKMGADIVVDGKYAIIHGVDTLYGTDLRAYELRGGAALVTAALLADGRSRIYGTEYIERGYEDICGELSKLGADIRKIEDGS